MRHVSWALVTLLLLTGCVVVPPTGGARSEPVGNGPRSAPISAAEPTSDPNASGPPRLPQVLSVTIRSRCRQSVRVFYGQKPKFGSGTTGRVSANSVESHSFKPGESMWLVDDADNGVTSTSVSERTREIEILPNCTGFVTR
jgi:hypothetical protein